MHVPKGRRPSDRSQDDWRAPDRDSTHHRRTSYDRGSHSHTPRFGGPDSAAGGGLGSSTRTRRRSSNASWSDDAASSTSRFTDDPSKEAGPSTNRSPELPKRVSVDLSSGWGNDDGSSFWSTTAGAPAGSGSSGWNADGWGASTSDKSAGKGSGTTASKTQWSSAGWGEPTALQSPITPGDTKFPSSSGKPITNSPSILAQTPAFSRLREPGVPSAVSLGKRPAQPVRRSIDEVVSTSMAATQRIAPDVEMRDGTQTLLSPTIAHPSKKPLPTRIRPPLPTRINTGSNATVRDAAENKSPPLPPVPPHDWTKVPLSGSMTARIKQDDAMSDVSETISQMATRDPKDIHAKLIKEVLYTVMLRYRLLKAEEKKGKWRDARASPCYQHSTPAAQKKLDTTNLQFSEELSKLSKQLNSSLKRVVRCSDALNAQRDLAAKGLDLKKVLRYTDELRDWIADLELPKRIFAARASIEKEKNEREAFKKRNREEVDQLKTAIEELELTATDIWDDFGHLQYTQPERFKEEFIAAEKALEEEASSDFKPDLENAFPQLNIEKGEVEVVRARVEDADGRLNSHTPKIEQLREQMKSLENELADLRAKDKEIKEFRQQAGIRIQQLEQWQADDKKRLDSLTQRVGSLHQVPRPVASRPKPTNLDEFSAFVDELVREHVTKEIKPALDAIAEACKRENRAINADFNKLLKQVVVKTYDLVQEALKARGHQIVPRPG